MANTPQTPRRRPARLERSGAMTPRDLMWAAIRAISSGQCAFSVADVMVLATASSKHGADTTPLKECTVTNYCTGLEKAGYLAGVQRTGEATRFRCMRSYVLLNDVGVNAPNVGADGKPTRDNTAARQQMWNAVRMRKGEFSRLDVIAVCTQDVNLTEEQAKFFLARLEDAGYVQCVDRGGVTKGKCYVCNRYRFIRTMNTGPRPPVIGRDLSVMDGNSGKIMAAGNGR